MAEAMPGPKVHSLRPVKFYSEAVGRSVLTGMVVAHQTFEVLLRWNLHFHALVLEGGFDGKGTFFYIPFSGFQSMVEVFRRSEIKLLVTGKLLNVERYALISQAPLVVVCPTPQPKACSTSQDSLRREISFPTVYSGFDARLVNDALWPLPTMQITFIPPTSMPP
ncbi:MAG: hypothetical protein AB1798_00345 [Spirochaetota bacterium]